MEIYLYGCVASALLIVFSIYISKVKLFKKHTPEMLAVSSLIITLTSWLFVVYFIFSAIISIIERGIDNEDN